jgi:2-polyprenyl-6-methoxyphenol hydroxylase-like FAD-dependent oxidoreductase
MARCDVLIAGAGPTGLVLALWLTKLGVSVRIIDAADQPGTTSRALAVQAHTLELYRQLDLALPVLEQGHNVPGVNLRVRGKPVARLGFESIGAHLTPFSFLEIFPQDEHERLLIERLNSMGVLVERRTALRRFTDAGDHIRATLRTPEAPSSRCEAAYRRLRWRALTGAAGMGGGFPGGTYRQVFYVADVVGSGPAFNGEAARRPRRGRTSGRVSDGRAGRARLIGTVRDERADNPQALDFADVSRRAIANLKVEVSKVNWFSTYRRAPPRDDHFRSGRAFVLGDAAPIHSPAGGRG